MTFEQFLENEVGGVWWEVESLTAPDHLWFFSSNGEQCQICPTSNGWSITIDGENAVEVPKDFLEG